MRVRARRVERQHDDRQPRRATRAGRPPPAPRARRAERPKGVLLPPRPECPLVDQGGAAAAPGRRGVLGPRRRVQPVDARPRHPRGRQHARRGAVGVHRGRRVRDVPQDPRRGRAGAPPRGVRRGLRRPGHGPSPTRADGRRGGRRVHPGRTTSRTPSSASTSTAGWPTSTAPTTWTPSAPSSRTGSGRRRTRSTRSSGSRRCGRSRCASACRASTWKNQRLFLSIPEPSDDPYFHQKLFNPLLEALNGLEPALRAEGQP